MLFLKIIIMLVIVALLAWMFFGAGCINNVRVRLQVNSIRINITILWLCLGIMTNIICFLYSMFHYKTYPFFNKKPILHSFCLLI